MKNFSLHTLADTSSSLRGGTVTGHRRYADDREPTALGNSLIRRKKRADAHRLGTDSSKNSGSSDAPATLAYATRS
jgi:hypothetical protein